MNFTLLLVVAIVSLSNFIYGTSLQDENAWEPPLQISMNNKTIDLPEGLCHSDWTVSDYVLDSFDISESLSLLEKAKLGVKFTLLVVKNLLGKIFERNAVTYNFQVAGTDIEIENTADMDEKDLVKLLENMIENLTLEEKQIDEDLVRDGGIITQTSGDGLGLIDSFWYILENSNIIHVFISEIINRVKLSVNIFEGKIHIRLKHKNLADVSCNIFKNVTDGDIDVGCKLVYLARRLLVCNYDVPSIVTSRELNTQASPLTAGATDLASSFTSFSWLPNCLIENPNSDVLKIAEMFDKSMSIYRLLDSSTLIPENFTWFGGYKALAIFSYNLAHIGNSPSEKYYNSVLLVSNEDPDDYLLVIRGTTTKAEFFIDLLYDDVAMMSIIDPNKVIGHGHYGFIKYSSELAESVHNFLQTQGVSKDSPVKLTLTGHSLGGALAHGIHRQLSNMDYLKELNVYSFAAPLIWSINDNKVKSSVKGKIYSQEYEHDFVTKIFCDSSTKLFLCNKSNLTGHTVQMLPNQNVHNIYYEDISSISNALSKLSPYIEVAYLNLLLNKFNHVIKATNDLLNLQSDHVCSYTAYNLQQVCGVSGVVADGFARCLKSYTQF